MLPRNKNYTIFRNQAGAKAVSAFMSGVYMWMMVGICISGITAYYVASRQDLIMYILQNKPVFYGLIIAQFATVFALSAFVQRMSVGLASTMYALYATLVGLTFSVLFLVYTMESISSSFFVTGFSFAGLSVFGYTTKRNLGPIGSFCMMGLFGLIGISLLSFFFPTLLGTSTQLAISAIAILIFAGLTAYDTQRIKALQYQFASAEEAKKGAIYGALILYLDFINLFLNILRLMGNRR